VRNGHDPYASTSSTYGAQQQQQTSRGGPAEAAQPDAQLDEDVLRKAVQAALRSSASNKAVPLYAFKAWQPLRRLTNEQLRSWLRARPDHYVVLGQYVVVKPAVQQVL
jgi:hypothetical protein